MVYNIIQISPILQPEQHLRIISCFIHHLKDFSVLETLIDNLKQVENNFASVYFDWIAEAQEEFLRFTQENPVYNYQFQSLKILGNDSLRTVMKMCNDFISSEKPDHWLVSSYYSCYLAESPPPSELLSKIKVNDSCWARLLWQMKDSFPCGEIASQALSQADFETLDPEYLYYLSSIVPWKIDFSKVPQSEFSLALAYNDSNSEPNFQYKARKLNLCKLPTEAVMKTIIKLIEFNDFQQIKAAIEFVGFVPENHPKYSPELIKRFMKALTEVNPSLINSQSIRVHLMKISEEVSSEELHQISKFLIYLPKKLTYEFMENFSSKGKLFEYNSLNDVQKCRNFVERFETGGLSKNSVHELKNIDFMKFAFKKYILSVLKNENFSDPDNLNIGVILEILSNTSPEPEIQTNLISFINRENVWDKLSFQDLCNLCLLHSKHQIFIPNYIHQRFLSVIYAKVNLEEKKINPYNNLLYIKPFKYTTELEPRAIISNNILKRQFLPIQSNRAEIPYHEVENNIKVLAYLNYLGMQRTPDIDESVRIYFYNRNSNSSFYNKKLALFEDLVQKYGPDDVQENNVDLTTGWINDFFIPSQKTAYKVLGESDYFINSDLKFELKYLTSLMIQQVEKNGTQVVCLKPAELEGQA